MRLLLTTARAGDRLSQPAGTIIEIGDAEGRRLLAAKQAERVEPEVAMTAAPQTAMRPAGRARGRA